MPLCAIARSPLIVIALITVRASQAANNLGQDGLRQTPLTVLL